MKVQPECILCLISRGQKETQQATKDREVQFKTIQALLKFLSQEFTSTAVPAYLGTERDRIIKRITGNSDPYKKAKEESNKKALKIFPSAKKIVSNQNSAESKFRKACLCAIVGNIIEFHIPNHTVPFNELETLMQNAEKDLAIDEIQKIFKAAQKAHKVLYLTDNAGEIAFDTLLIQQLKNLGKHVTVAVKGGPVLNDATVEDAKFVGMDKIADRLITTGADAVGLLPNECSNEFLNVYNSVDLVIAKGMGYAETLTELTLKCPHALLMRTKCNPVANFFHVNKGKNVAKLML
ncbi:MAG: ARMT1-like domain-containing protein [Thermoproteota archaeon]|nr:ARMT1-like domain-containing protein [Thermoproteota archaeon]